MLRPRQIPRGALRVLIDRLERKGPLAVKIAVPLVGISVAVAAVLGVTMVTATRQSFARTYATQAESLADLVATAYARDPQDRSGISAFLTDVWSSVPAVRRIRVYRDDDGAAVLWASTDPAEIDHYQPRPDEVAPIATGTGGQREQTFGGERMLETIEPVRLGARRVVASVGVFTSLRERDQAVAAITRQTVLVAALGVAAELAALWTIFFLLVLRRMARLSRVASQVAEGDLAVRLPEGRQTAGEDEVFKVAREFDHMLSTVRARTHQQAAVSKLGQRALEGAELARLLEETAKMIVENLDVEYVGILKHAPHTSTFLLQAGAGWREGVVGRVTAGERGESLAGYTLESGEPVIVKDYRQETRFKVPAVLREHHLISGMSVIIPGQDRPYGVLAAHTAQESTFTTDDVQFLQAMANTLGWAIRHKYAQEQLREARVLEMIAKNEPLSNVLNTLTEMVESQWPGALCAMLLAQDGSLHHVAGRRLPDGYIQTIDGAPIGPDSGLAGVTAHGREAVIVGDLATDTAWRDKEERALAAGLRACWAVPISSGDGGALGSFLTYHREPKMPTAEDLRLLGATSYLATIAVEQRSLMEKLSYQAHHDALTGLPNRVLFEDRLQQAIAQAKRNGDMVALLFADLDNFKRINETLGHHIGDALLRYVAQRFESRIRQSDTLARMGGDEFAVVLTGIKDPKDAAGIAQKLLDALASAFDVNGTPLFLNGSIGISLSPQDGQEAAILQRNADTAMYRAKVQGDNSFRFFAPEMHAEALERLELDTSLRRALQDGELSVHYQPQFDLGSRKIVGAEALLRWHHPSRGLIPPATFIPMAEETGLILPIGTWVLEEACRQNAAWQRAGYRPMRVSVNVSALQFGRPDFVQTVSQALRVSGLSPQWLDLEVTESMLMRELEDVRRRLAELRELGVRVAIDDFGTGYSSLGYLQQLPIDSLKIDRSFVRNIKSPVMESDHAPNLVKTIVSLAHSLGMEVVAEGVETVDQLEFLHALRCEKGQGYLVARPMPAVQVAAILERLAPGSDVEVAA